MTPRSSITLIEDNEADAYWFGLILRELIRDCEVTVFATGVEALAAFERAPAPDLIVTDWYLPILDVPHLIGRIRSIPGYERTPVAVLTGHVEHRGLQAIEAGAFSCFAKPIEADQLKIMLDQAWAIGASSSGPDRSAATP